MVRMRNSMEMLGLLSIVLAALLSGIGWAGDLEPSAPPGPTMKTLDQVPPIWSQTLPTATRFVLVLGGAGVLDRETGLVWEQSPSTTKTQWYVALNNCSTLVKGNRLGWRLPTIEELSSLIDPAQSNPALPSGHPFSNVQYGNALTDAYFSITNFPQQGGDVFVRRFNSSTSFAAFPKTITEAFYWCVRGGHGIDPSAL